MKIKKKLIKNITMLLFGFMVVFNICCSQKSISKSEYQQIDAGAFVVTVPSNYKLIKERGIDSYVGRVSNGIIEFEFDYGWYSNSEPQTYYEYVEKYLLRVHKEELKEICSITDSIMENLYKNLNVLDARLISNYSKASKNKISTTIQLGTGNCTIKLDPINPDLYTNYEQFNFDEYIKDDFRYKLFYPKKDVNEAGVFIQNLAEKRKDRFNYTKISFNTNNFNELNSKEIMDILKSVRIKKD